MLNITVNTGQNWEFCVLSVCLLVLKNVRTILIVLSRYQKKKRCLQPKLDFLYKQVYSPLLLNARRQLGVDAVCPSISAHLIPLSSPPNKP